MTDSKKDNLVSDIFYDPYFILCKCSDLFESKLLRKQTARPILCHFMIMNKQRKLIKCHVVEVSIISCPDIHKERANPSNAV